MKYSGFCLSVVLIMGFALKASAQVQAPNPSNSTTPANYVLGPEDGININVINFPNLSIPQLVIPPDGKITVALLKDPLLVTGKTTTEVAQMLSEKWQRYIKNPSISVSLISRRRENILAYGFVMRSGVIEYRSGKHILEALAEVGGAAPQGDLSKVTVTRRSGDRQILDLSHPETKGGTELDILLDAGAVIYVPERRTQFTVVGEVLRPGSFEYREEMTVMDAITTAGGIRETADLANSTLIHDEKEARLDLEALLRRGDGTVNKKLSVGDRIVVPEIKNRVYFFGSVGRPGYYIFKPEDTVMDALNGVGGPTREANLSRVNHIRTNKTTKKSSMTVVNLDQLLRKGETKGNITLEPGDILFVPDKKRGFQLQDMFGVLTGINTLESIGRIFGFR